MWRTPPVVFSIGKPWETNLERKRTCKDLQRSGRVSHLFYMWRRPAREASIVLLETNLENKMQKRRFSNGFVTGVALILQYTYSAAISTNLLESSRRVHSEGHYKFYVPTVRPSIRTWDDFLRRKGQIRGTTVHESTLKRRRWKTIGWNRLQTRVFNRCVGNYELLNNNNRR